MHRKRTEYVRLAALALLGIIAGAGNSYAETIIVTGAGFTGYSGPASDPASLFGPARLTVSSGAVPLTPTPGTVGVSPLRPDIGLTTANFPVSQFVDFFIPNEGDVNRIQFTPACTGAPCLFTPGVEFLLGTFSLTNGSFFLDAPAFFDFRIDYTSTDSLGNETQATFTDTIVYISTTGAGATEAERADFFYFRDSRGLGSMRVYELGATAGPNTGAINIYGKINSPLALTRFGDSTGGVFFSSSTDLDPNAGVPEPGTWATAGAGLLALVLRKRCQAKA